MAQFVNKNFTHLVNCWRKKLTGAALEGSSRCFSKNQLVKTISGIKKISEIEEGDMVLTFNEKTGLKEYKKVLKKHKFVNKKKSIRVKLKNGIIEATEDHEFYCGGKWVSLKNILNERNKKIKK